MDDIGPACVRCAYAVAHYRHLECRLKPPVPDYKNHGRIFPMMMNNDWCTKYKIKPELLVEPEPELSESLRQTLEEWKEE
jgi:hypothetical protein